MTYREQLTLYGTSGGHCRCCGGPIVWDNSKIYISRSGDIKFAGRTHQSSKNVNGNVYYLQCCQNCFEQMFHRAPCFGTMCESTKWAYNVSDEDYNAARSKYAMTRGTMFRKYGKEIGEQKWSEYCARQIETKSWEYLVTQYGEKRAREINRSKAITLENMIRVHGEIDGPKRYRKWLSQFSNREPQRWSKTSQSIFNTMRPIVEEAGYSCQYKTHGGEFAVVTHTGGYLLDFYIPELKVGIEYNGGCFHAEPRLYKDDEHCDPLRPTLTALEIRQYDLIRKQSIQDDLGITIYELWELDYNDGIDITEFIRNIINKHTT